MKEIKAYIRTKVLADTIDALKEVGVPGITVTSVHPVGYGFDPKYFLPQTKDPGRNYPTITKLEVVCTDEDVDRLVKIISGNSYTGTKGDGVIFVTHVEKAVKIRTGEEGDAAL